MYQNTTCLRNFHRLGPFLSCKLFFFLKPSYLGACLQTPFFILIFFMRHIIVLNFMRIIIFVQKCNYRFNYWVQVLEPSLSKGNRVMVFCNTLNSSRAVDHFLSENQISTVNYHGEVPAEERFECSITLILFSLFFFSWKACLLCSLSSESIYCENHLYTFS